MDEPSVLDYIKAKLKFWERSELRFPSSEEVPVNPEQDAVVERESLEPIAVEEQNKPHRILLPEIKLPWRSLTSIIVAFIGQRLLEPPDPSKDIAIALYLVAFGMLIWAAISNEWNIVHSDDQVDLEWSAFKFRWQYILIGTGLAVLAFLSFGDNLFTFINLPLWIGSILLFLAGFLDLELVKEGVKNLIDKIRQGHWEFHFNWWSLLILATAILIIFFRITQLSTVPPEMTSDHAEKLMDVQDVLNGHWSVFFTRNTGREAFQFYLTALIIKLFHTGISFMSLKIGMVAAGLLTLPYIYLTAKEFWNRRVAFFALIFAGIAFWPNVISRVGLRFALYPLFTAPAIYYLLRGLKYGKRNDFIWAGIAIGLGMHGYSPYRVVPLLALFAVLLFILHRRNRPSQEKAIFGTIMMGITAIIVAIPLLRYALDNPDIVSYRFATRMTSLERPIPGNPVVIFLDNIKNAMLMFGVNDGTTWLHSIPDRPALDILTAALFYLGLIYLLYRYIRYRRWIDLFVVLSVPILMLPSILSIAFPEENPVLNRTAGAIIPVYLIIGICSDGFIGSLENILKGWGGKIIGILAAALMILFSARQNLNFLLGDYLRIYKESSGNTSEMGHVIRGFADSVGTPDSAWVVGFPYWVDTRLVSIEAGFPIRDYAIWPDQFETTRQVPGPKLFILNTQDGADLTTLMGMYPAAKVSTFTSQVPGRDFLIMLVGPGY